MTFEEARGDFFARIPGSQKQQSYPSTVAYLAALILHRFQMLGILDAKAQPVEAMGVMESAPGVEREAVREVGDRKVRYIGKQCPECHEYAVRKVDGCDRCEACGAIGSCG